MIWTSSWNEESADDDLSKLRILLSLSQGVRTLFDQRTHCQLRQVFNRFTYIYLAALLLENRTAEDVTDAVLDHLEEADSVLQTTWGQSEFARLSSERHQAIRLRSRRESIR